MRSYANHTGQLKLISKVMCARGQLRSVICRFALIRRGLQPHLNYLLMQIASVNRRQYTAKLVQWPTLFYIRTTLCAESFDPAVFGSLTQGAEIAKKILRLLTNTSRLPQ